MKKRRNSFLIVLLLLFVHPASAIAVDNQAELTVMLDEQALGLRQVSNLQFDGESATLTQNFKLTIADVRGSGNGWSLKVSISEFVEEASKRPLKGVVVKFDKGKLYTANENQQGSAPIPRSISVKAGADHPASELLRASPKKGLGTWQYEIAKEKCKIEIPKQAPPGNYSATIRWELVDAPM